MPLPLQLDMLFTGNAAADGDMEQVPHGPASGNTRVEAALAAAREVKQAAANKTHIPTANSQKAKYDKPAWARAVDSHLTVKGSVAVSKKHQLAISGLFHSQGSGKSTTEKKRMLPSDTLKRISDGVSARSLKRSRKVEALPTAANRPTRTAANTASKIIENMDLTTDDNEVDDDNETEYVIEEGKQISIEVTTISSISTNYFDAICPYETMFMCHVHHTDGDVESDPEDQPEEEEHEEEEEKDDDVANEEEIIKSLAVEGKALVVRSDGDEVFLFITTDGIKEGAKRVPGGFLRELAPGASYGRNAKLKRNEVLFGADNETQKRILELVTADPSARYFTRYEAGKFKRHEWQTTIELGSFIVLDDDHITVAHTWTSTAGPMDLRTSDIFKCAFSNQQLQRLLAGEEQVVEKTTGGDNGLDEMAMDAEAAGLAVDGEAAELAVDGEAAGLAMDGEAAGLLMDGEAGGVAVDAVGEAAGLAMDGEAAVLAIDGEAAGLAVGGEADGLAVDGEADGLAVDAEAAKVGVVSMDVTLNPTTGVSAQCATPARSVPMATETGGNDIELPLN
ncbi:hypothetical protein CYMTET_41878 [Cymbomonas tetramitiformis]|uniref:Uncharacterized protein n=1 Tax=Cymbomonas tetramitiformis TaxID=36881 RepID=A0AAE0C6X3_9CHLO|nr:hypothetical protein CYMTET_41878 [Cymbomonas tetramitiformis]